MSLLAMPAPSPPHTSSSFRRGLSPWDSDTARPASNYGTLSRPRVDPEQIALPSIRQAIPELQLRVLDSHSVHAARPAVAPTGPPSMPPMPSMPSPNASVASTATLEYVHSPSSSYKRQRVSAVPGGDDRSERFSQIPRLCPAPPHLDRSGTLQRGITTTATSTAASASPTLMPLRSTTSASVSPPISSASSSATAGNMSAATDGWANSSSTSLSTTTTTTTTTANRRGLPGLAQLRFERESGPLSQLRSGYAGDAYSSAAASASSDGYRYPQQSQQLQQQHHSPTGPSHTNGAAYGAPSTYQHHPSRLQSLSVGSIRGFDRAAFPSANGSNNNSNINGSNGSNGSNLPYGHHHPHMLSPVGYPRDYMAMSEFGSLSSIGMVSSGGGGSGGAGDTKQRKRRGNLPKETTDKLRAWFVAHLHHPYPSEDEKQDLMRQTGLQMNQISNWFINARRRQLPAMINNARVESDAMSSSRGGGSSAAAAAAAAAAGGRGSGSRHQEDRHSLGHVHGNHGKILPSTEHMLASPERTLIPRPAVLYGVDHTANKHGSPMSEDDYDDLPRHHGHMKRGSV